MPPLVQSLSPQDPRVGGYLAVDRGRHLFHLGLLEHPESEETTVSAALRRDGSLAGVALLYREGPRVKLLAACNPATMGHLLSRMDLPERLAFQLESDLLPPFLRTYRVEWSKSFLTSLLSRRSGIQRQDGVRRLVPGDFPALQRLAVWVPEVEASRIQFHARPFVGFFSPDGELVAVAGAQVLSSGFGVAAIGNVGVHPGFRRVGWGRRVVLALLAELTGQADIIGLQVAEENEPARRLYDTLGFQSIGRRIMGIASRIVAKSHLFR